MKKLLQLLLVAFIVLFNLCLPRTLHAQRRMALFTENFKDLNAWKPLNFPKIEKHSKYSIKTTPMETYLITSSKASASGIIYKKEFNIYKFPGIMWQWKVKNVYQKGDAKTKEGDDYPLRIYIIFKYDPDKASFAEKLKYEAAKLIYGEYPPHSSLNYIWANKKHKEKIITSPYTDKAKMVILQEGKKNLGKWVIQEVNIMKDYIKAFKKPPPATASIAIMNDSDNTGESAVSYVNYMQVYRPKD